jgi:hypothetical protein
MHAWLRNYIKMNFSRYGKRPIKSRVITKFNVMNPYAIGSSMPRSVFGEILVHMDACMSEKLPKT